MQPNLIGRLLRAIGFRARRKGAGRKRSPEGLDLLEIARAKYGARFLKALRAACRAGKEETAVGAPDCAPAGPVAELPVESPLPSGGAYNMNVLSPYNMNVLSGSKAQCPASGSPAINISGSLLKTKGKTSTKATNQTWTL
jgi:hypothetical protein